ncbi:MAG: tRNA (adenosine(37)-N6)-dimethylallyltransferase [Solirubrobacterales bacterium]
MKLVAIFGPTGVGKTGVAIAVAERLREWGEDPVALSCDAIQVYRGLEVLSGAANEAERERLEHRLLGIVPVNEEFSAGRFAKRAHAEIDSLLAAGRRPILVGGTGLYLRAALAELDLRPPVPETVREEVERELSERGAPAMHAELPTALAASVHPNDAKRIARWTELSRVDLRPESGGEGMWSAAPRVPSLLIGLEMDRDALAQRIDDRVEGMAAGAAAEARAAEAAGISRTARAALGFDEFLAGDLAGVKTAHRRYARRQLTWMRRMEGVKLIDRTTLGDETVASDIVSRLG